MKFRIILLLLITSILHMQPAAAVKIVRLELVYGSDTFVATGGFDIPKTNKVLDLELFDEFDEAPTTVANYLNYVNSGRYDLTFFNRSVPGFILQTGGVTNQSVGPENEPIDVSSFVPVEEFPAVVNESGISNTRGTIAMAMVPAQFIENGCVAEGPGCTLRPGTGPDSANSEWFINLKDNSIPLDTDNGGFTVFGSVIDDGMETADQIVSFPVVNLFFLSFITGASFDTLPFADDTLSSAAANLYQRNLFMITSVTEISRPIVRFTPTVSNFGFESTGSAATGKSVDVVLRNTGNEVLDIAPIGDGTLGAQFSIQSENCSNASLDPVSVVPASTCTISLLFLPTSTGVFNDNLNIDYTSQISNESFSVKYPLIGEGALGPPVISVVETFDVGASQVAGFASTKDIIVGNDGQASLQISAISGLNLTGFSQTNDCIGNSILIAPGETCSIAVNFTTNEFGAKVATLSIESNDAINNVIDITLSGYGDSDADGIASAIEDAAPNSGDNDINGISDSVQNDVASFTSKTGDYISLVVDANNVVSNISVIPDGQLVDLPTDVVFKQGVLEFEVVNVLPGAIIEIGLILPSDASLEGYYFYGKTETNPIPHWYRYQLVQVSPNGKQTGPNGKIVRNFIQLAVQDGGPGDADQLVNGRILLAPGAPAYSVNGSSSASGAINILFLGFFTLIMIEVKRRTQRPGAESP